MRTLVKYVELACWGYRPVRDKDTNATAGSASYRGTCQPLDGKRFPSPADMRPTKERRNAKGHNMASRAIRRQQKAQSRLIRAMIRKKIHKVRLRLEDCARDPAP